MKRRKGKRIVIGRQAIDNLPDEVYREVILQGFRAMKKEKPTRYRVAVAQKITYHYFKTMKDMDTFIKATRRHNPKANITWKEVEQGKK